MSKNPNGNMISLDVETADRLLKEVVPSQEMQDYLKKIGHRFTDREYATLMSAEEAQEYGLVDAVL